MRDTEYELKALRKICSEKESVIAGLHDQLNTLEAERDRWRDEAYERGYEMNTENED